MTAAELHEAGSAIEAAARMNPGAPIKMDPLKVAWMLMWAAATIAKQDCGDVSVAAGDETAARAAGARAAA